MSDKFQVQGYASKVIAEYCILINTRKLSYQFSVSYQRPNSDDIYSIFLPTCTFHCC